MSQKLLGREKLETAYITYSTMFDMALATRPVLYPEITTLMPNAGPVNKLNWLGSVPVMQEWLGDRVISKLRAEDHELRTKWYSNGIELDTDDIREDRLGIVQPRISQLASMGPRKIDALATDFYLAGFAGTLGTTYDGQFLFDSDHKSMEGVGSNQTNLQTGALSATTFNQALEKMWAFVDDVGEPLEIRGDTIMAGPSNQLTLRTILQQQFKASGESNVDLGTARGIVNARIIGAHATKWFLIASGEIRPVMVGIEFPPEFAMLDGDEQLKKFMSRQILAGAHMKVGLAYALWQAAVGSLGT